VTVLKLFWGKCCYPLLLKNFIEQEYTNRRPRLLWLPEFIDEIHRKREYDKEEDYET